jgi:rubrerythrin
MIDENTTPYEALILALEKEKEAYALYKKAAEVVKDQSVKKMFDFLAKEEIKHQRLIQDEIDKGWMQEF